MKRFSFAHRWKLLESRFPPYPTCHSMLTNLFQPPPCQSCIKAKAKCRLQIIPMDPYQSLQPLVVRKVLSESFSCILTVFGTKDTSIDYSDELIPNTPVLNNLSTRKFRSLFSDDDDELHPIYVNSNELPTNASTSVNNTNEEDEYQVSDIELTDEVLALLDHPHCISHSTSPIDETHSEEEHIVPHIDLTSIDYSDELIPNTPVLNNPSTRKFRLLFSDDDDELHPIYVSSNELRTNASTSVNNTNQEDEYHVYDIELTDEVLALLDHPHSISHSTSAMDETHSEDEYIVSDIDLTDEVMALLDNPYSHIEDNETNSDDEYVASEIEFTEELVSLLDKNYTED